MDPKTCGDRRRPIAFALSHRRGHESLGADQDANPTPRGSDDSVHRGQAPSAVDGPVEGLRLKRPAQSGMSKPVNRFAYMLDVGRRGEAMSNQLAPFLEVRRAAKVDRVVFHALPFDEKAIARGLLDRALKLHAFAPLRTLKNRRSLFDAGFELVLHSWLHVDL